MEHSGLEIQISVFMNLLRVKIFSHPFPHPFLPRSHPLFPPRLGPEANIIVCFYHKQSFGSSTAVCVPGDAETPESSCLVTIGKLQPTSIPQSSDLMDSPPVTEFISRHSLDGKFTFVDQR